MNMPWSIDTKIALVQMQLVMTPQGEVTDSFPQNSQTHEYMYMRIYVCL